MQPVAVAVPAMHIPDGFINGPVSIAAMVIAALGVALCLWGARRQLDERTAPLAGLVAVFVFAMQMLNFPVAAGTSGHLLGGALAAILVGPFAGAVTVSVVILVQALLFADGGLSALGLNIINMGLITALVSWVVFRAVIRATGVSRTKVIAASFIAGFVAVPMSALGFVLEYGIGGTGTISWQTVLLAMTGVHLLIGIGEGIITALTVAAVYLARPDLVYGVRDLLPNGARDAESTSRTRRSIWGLIAAGLGISAIAAGVVSFYASSSPDGLERVAEDQGFIDTAKDSATSGLATADYGIAGIANERLSVGLAGLIGVAVMVIVGFGLFWLLSRRRRGSGDAPASARHSHGHDVGERLLVHRHSVVHQLPAEVKTVAMVAFILIVVFTPATSYWAFAIYAALLIGVAVVAQIPARIILPRMLIEVPFILFAVFMPFFGTGATVTVLGLTLYSTGLIAAWNILIKGTLGVLASILLASTTPSRDLLLGLERLRMPTLIVQIAAFMLRYVHVVTDEMGRMRLAREARGFTATGVRSWPVLAQSAGALFIRSYERGERVHLAMLSRGYTGRLPVLDSAVTLPVDWARALLLPATALVVALLTVVVSR